MKPGDIVKIGAGGVSRFVVVSVDDESGSAVIESAVDAPGRYPFGLKCDYLVPVDPN